MHGNTSRRYFIGAAGSLGFMAVAHPVTQLAFANSILQTHWSPLELSKISIAGELLKRTQQNWRRLQHPAYGVPNAFASVTSKAWPGDWVGRDLLAKTLLARSTSQDSGAAGLLVEVLPSRLNSAGYLGELLDPDALNEQQLAGHGWLLRGLCEYSAWTADARVREVLDTMARNLSRALAGAWQSYPLTPELRRRGTGGVVGHTEGQVGRWRLSTDIGCIFILLDGLTHAWRIVRDPALKAVIDEAVEQFLRLDVQAVQAQTHATLTALRALLRLYGLTQDKRLLRAVEERYDLYRRVAMTENYANYNWFGRPETWTEPCAIIDSFMVATQLWQYTGEPKYLEDAHLIWFNGVGRGQRATGGFGCDTCAGFKDPFMQMALVYEATFCCTMRGGEGHSYAIQSAYHARPGELAVTFYSNSKAEVDVGNGRLVLEQSTQYPYDGAIQLKVTASTVTAPITVRLFAPSWFSNPHVKLNGRKLDSRMNQGFLTIRFIPKTDDVLALESKLRTWVQPTRNPQSLHGYHVFHAGPLLLGYDGGQEMFVPETAELSLERPGYYRVQGRNLRLGRINDLNEFPLPSWDPLDPEPVESEKRKRLNEQLLIQAPSSRRQVIFRRA